MSTQPTTITRALLERCLAEAGIEHRVVPLGAGPFSIVVSSYGGRVYGPFAGESAESEMWLPDAFGSAESFAELVRSGFWNVGGERIWVGPEIRYMIPDRSDYWGSYTMPPDIDPGVHTLADVGAAVALTSRIRDAESFLAPLGHVQFDVTKTVAAVQNPLRQLDDGAALMHGLEFGGWRTSVGLAQHSAVAGIESESWNLAQIRGGGVALIPAVPGAVVTDYYEPVGEELERVDGGIAVTLSGAQRFKLGVKAAHNFGRLAFVRRVDAVDPNAETGQFTLTVRLFPNDPSSSYTEEPDFSPGVSGDSLHLYNDDGRLGGFAELESRGRTVGRTAGTTRSTDEFTTWFFRGDFDHIDAAARALVGMCVPASIREFSTKDTAND